MHASKIVIVESPAKSSTISKYLGGEYKVVSSMGHVVDLPTGKFGVDIAHDFEPEYIVMSSRKKIVSELKKAARDADTIYIATDPDREGEAIGWHLERLLGKGKKVLRVTFYEITKNAILEAFGHPAVLDENKVLAQQARRILDRIVGYKISPLLWKKVSRGLSAGRVQSVALRFIVEREKEIKNFVPQEYWDLEAIFRRTSPHPLFDFSASLEKIEHKAFEIKSAHEAEAIKKDVMQQSFSIFDIKTQEKKKNPPAPFTTSKLQQEAFNKLHFTANKTMRVAQQLYEGMELGSLGPTGLITYMRTDSVRISKEAQKDALRFIEETFGKDFVPETPPRYKEKSHAQQAHEAIRPTLAARSPESIKEYLDKDQYALYELIWKRFLASQMKYARYETITVLLEGGRYLFKSTATRNIFPGFTKLYESDDEAAEGKNTELFTLAKTDAVALQSLTPGQHFTKPPARFTDASLVKVLEENGIGRPSTYAPIIETLTRRHYVTRRRGVFFPTELGITVTGLLMDHFALVMDTKFTANMELELDEIEEGRLDWKKVLHEFYAEFDKVLQHAQENMKSVKAHVEMTDKVCPQCGKPMVIKWGKRGRFLSCSGFPACRFAQSITTGVPCPRNCGGELVERRGMRGRMFYGCSNYPKCNYTATDLPKEGKETKEEKQDQ
jgi:DNA topoisomerase-1